MFVSAIREAQSNASARAVSFGNLGVVLRLQSPARINDSVAAIRQGIGCVLLGTSAEEKAIRANLHRELAASLEAANETSKAIVEFQNALTLYDSDNGGGKRNKERAQCLYSLGRLSAVEGKQSDAQQYYQQALDLAAGAFGQRHKFVAEILSRYAFLCSALRSCVWCRLFAFDA